MNLDEGVRDVLETHRRIVTLDLGPEHTTLKRVLGHGERPARDAWIDAVLEATVGRAFFREEAQIIASLGKAIDDQLATRVRAWLGTSPRI
jgi:hypothetical protein